MTSETFAEGAAVAVRAAWPPGHLRVPSYVRGRTGSIAQVLGSYPNPEELAYGRPGLPAPTLYRVRFRQRNVWPDYSGGVDDTIDVEISHHWLEPAA